MKRISIIMSILGILTFTSCAQSGRGFKNAHIKRFYFHYDGTIGGDTHNYNLVVEDRKAIFKLEDFEVIPSDDPEWSTHREMVDTLDMTMVRELEQLCTKHEVYKFNGFDKDNPFVTDGEGFSLRIVYDNGKEIEARGMNRFPNGYREFEKDLEELFRPYCEQLKKKAFKK